MLGDGGSMESAGPPRTRQRRFDTQPSSSEDENEQQEMPELAGSDSESDDERPDQRKPVDPLSTEDDLASEDQSSSGKKRKKPNVKREFILHKTWSKEEHETDDVHAAIRVELGLLNAEAGMSKLKTLQHQDRNSIYGDWIFQRHWMSAGGAVSNKVFTCPLVRLAACTCQAKIVETPRVISLSIANKHSAADHADKDSSKYLKAEQRKFISDAVKIAPLQTASELIRNVQTSPTKAIHPRLKHSVRRLIMNERRKLHAVTLEGIEVIDQIGPLQQFTDRIWITDARDAHKEGVKNNQPACIPLHKVFCIGRAFNSDETYTMLAFATPWNLLNYFRSIGSGYPGMLQGDVTGKASSLALNKLGLGFNRLGGHYCQWTSNLIPPRARV